MVGATRGTPNGFGQPSGSGSQQPQPPPLDLVECIAAQTELLCQIIQGQQIQQQQRDGHNVHQPQVASYLDFLGTQPPVFNVTEEPLDADAWIRTIESKFSLLVVPCSDANKALFATQQLHGTTHLWWDHYNTLLPDDHIVT